MILIPMILIIGFIAIIALGSSVKIVSTGEAYIVEKLGVYSRTLQPGVHFLVPFIETVVSKVSLKRQVMDAQPQAVITKDNVSVMIDTITYYTILDAKACKYNIEDYKQAIYYTALTSMRAIVGEMTLDELLSSRDAINKRILSIVDNETDAYGIKVTSCEIKNIHLPDSIRISMEQLMTSKKDKEAKITKAEGDRISAIESAEGERQSKILKAQADKEYAILQAQGQQEAILLQAQAEAKAIQLKAMAEAKAVEALNKSILESGTNETVIALKQVEALIEMSKNPANKLILPTENMSTLGNISAIAETLKMSKEN